MALVTISLANIAADAIFNHRNYTVQLLNKAPWPTTLEKQLEQILREEGKGELKSNVCV